MISVRDAIDRRVTCLHYSTKKVLKKDILAVIDAARKAPSSHNAQDWSFVVIKNEKRIEELISLCYYGAFYEIPPVVIACIAHPLYQNKKTLRTGKIKERIPMHKYLNMGFAIDHLVLTATSIGLQSAIISPDIAKAGTLLNVPKSSETVLLVALGYGTPKEKVQRKKIAEIVYFEEYA